MAYELSERLVIGVASSALFDLAESDDVFRSQGEDAYRRYQEEHLDDTFAPGVAFPFIRRLLSLNDLAAPPAGPLVEVIVLSHNDPDTGLRVMRSIQTHKLGMSRAIFTQGQSPHAYIPALSMSLFLSKNGEDVRDAVQKGFPAGQVIGTSGFDDGTSDLRIGFDFDGVLADDGAERVFAAADLPTFREHEASLTDTPLDPGPLHDLLAKINTIQRIETDRHGFDRSYVPRLRVSIVTARDAPAHERAVNSLKSWGVTANDAFFLGGIDKGRIIEVLKPHIFFDDQLPHLQSTAIAAPSVHVPFGIRNLVQTVDPASAQQD